MMMTPAHLLTHAPLCHSLAYTGCPVVAPLQSQQNAEDAPPRFSGGGVCAERHLHLCSSHPCEPGQSSYAYGGWRGGCDLHVL